MLPEERHRLIAFALSICAVYAIALVFVLRRVFGASPRIASPTERRVELGAYSLATLGVACFLYALLIEPYWPEITHTQITSSKLPHRLRIVHLSDLHSDPIPRLEERLPALIRAEHPDLIVFTGDSINSPEGLPVFRRCLTQLASIAPTIVVRGNWDVWHWGAIDLFARTGAREVEGTGVLVPLQGDSVWVGGLSVDREGELAALMASAPHDAFHILLHHYPDEILRAAQCDVDLYLAGHTHGGQVALPFYGALITLSRFGKRFEHGLHRVEDTWLYVTRGVGMEGGAPRVRFFARPEVTVIDVLPSAAKQPVSN